MGSGSLLLDLGECYVRIPVESLKTERTQAERVEGGKGFSRPDRVVEFVENEQSAFGHPRHEVPQRRLGWFVKVAVNEEQADDQVRMFFEKSGNGVANVA